MVRIRICMKDWDRYFTLWYWGVFPGDTKAHIGEFGIHDVDGDDLLLFNRCRISYEIVEEDESLVVGG